MTYSVDKQWRLTRACLNEETNDRNKSGWFANEQLTDEEMRNCERVIQRFDITGKVVNFVMTHTCPYDYRPTDMFLNFIDQSTVDNSMELWMNRIKEMFTWHVWLFGHYHADRIERPYIEQYYNDIEELDTIHERWLKYSDTGELDWWLEKGPMFYAN